MEEIDCDGAKTAYVALELSKGTWMIGAILPGPRETEHIQDAKGRRLGWCLSWRSFDIWGDARLILCLEAGYDGFWLARFLLRRRIVVRVLDPAGLQVNRRLRCVKTDRIDLLSLLNALLAIDPGERRVCSVVRILSVEQEDARRSVANSSTYPRAHSHTNRIKGRLFAPRHPERSAPTSEVPD